ncbi:class E sortase [Streptomyces aidingensis]|uniref:LPXTG-site transpeptidase (Sortase) family protein n=1 Tax=Streptomyces aidingensis TaxID=910347 RepID=A0A1I1QUG1_9ACTN|nr:class E sortase [Streptomyces aidingensis]SFD22903.1 LPXTG-site transpeptidase (sortase) family protein [Streptomyces aidingensis]
MPSSTESAHEAPAGQDQEPEAQKRSDAAAPRRPSRTVRIVAGAVSVVGELLITAGVVLGLFVVYSLWWTNVLADREAARDSDAVRDLWEEQEQQEGDPGGTPADEPPPVFDPADGLGFLHIPAMTGTDILVKEGTGDDVLNGGVAGYYAGEPVESAMPWDEEGNFSLAAHRDGHGARFHNIHRIEEGDAIVFETKDTWYIYKVYAILPETSRYNTEVLDPIPEESGATEAGRYITLTTCTPIRTSRYRYIVWGELDRTVPVDENRTPPPELS